MSLPALFTVFLYFSLFILIPGFLLFNLIFKDKKSFTWIELIPLSFVFGLVFFAMIGLPAYLLHFSHIVFLTLFCSVIGIILLVDIYLFITKKRNFVLESSKYSVLITLFFVLLALLLVILYFPNIDLSGDRYIHTGVMRHLAIKEPITPYFNLFKDVTNKVDAPYGYNIWHLFGSMIFRAIHIDPNLIWEYLIIILTPIQMLSFGFLLRKLNKNNLFYFFALTIYFILAGIYFMGWEWRLLPYPDQIARNIMMPIILGLWILLLQKEKLDKVIILGIVLSGVTLLLIHMFSVIYFVIAIVGMMIFSFLAEKKYHIFKKGFYILATWLIASTPILYLKYLAYQQVVPTSFGTAASKTLTIGKYFIVNPNIWKTNLIYFAIITTILLLIWQFIKKRKISLPILFCFVLIFFAAFISFVPPVSAFFGKIITSTYLARLVSIIPVYFVPPILLFELVKNHKILAKVTIIGLIIALCGLVYSQKAEFKDIITKRTNRLSSMKLKNSSLYNYVDQNIPKDAVIAASDRISYELFTTTNSYLVMIPQGNCPAIIDKTERLTDLGTMLNPELTSQSKSLFEKYQVDYIIPKGSDVEKFKKQSQLFTKIYNVSDQNIFRINQIE